MSTVDTKPYRGESRNEIVFLKSQIDQLSDSVSQSRCYEQLLSFTQIRQKNAEIENLYARMKQQSTSSEQMAINENVEVIKIQRQLREKAGQLAEATAKLTQAENVSAVPLS